MTGLDKIRTYMAERLKRYGVEAVTAWPGTARQGLDSPTVAVSLRSCSAGPGGFQDYLGERLDPASGRWQELYGRRVKVVFGLDIYAGPRQGEAGCQAVFDQLAQALQEGGGLRLVSLSREAVVFDRELELLCCPVEAACDAWLYAVADEGGRFLDFMVKGELDG